MRKLQTLLALSMCVPNILNTQTRHSFEQATYAFEAVLQQHPTDATAKLFLTKAKWLLKAGVAEDWTGIEQMEKY